MKQLTAVQFEDGLQSGDITISQVLPGASGIVFVGILVGTNETLFRVVGL